MVNGTILTPLIFLTGKYSKVLTKLSGHRSQTLADNFSSSGNRITKTPRRTMLKQHALIPGEQNISIIIHFIFCTDILVQYMVIPVNWYLCENCIYPFVRKILRHYSLNRISHIMSLRDILKLFPSYQIAHFHCCALILRS